MPEQTGEVVQELWDLTRERLRARIDPQAFTAWIEPIHSATYAGGRLQLKVPSRFMAEWLERHFFDDLSSLAREVDPACREVTIEVEHRPVTNEGLVQPLPIVMDQPARRARQAAPARERERRPPLHTLDPKNTFDSFVIGTSNKFASAACRAVAESPGVTYNPLFLYGGVGLGKTHLMQAIGQEVASRSPSSAVLYMTSEIFTNELIAAIQNRSTEAFRARYRSVDVLLIDDIQFIGGRDSTQEEFFHTFNALHGARKQVVLTSDRPPKDIQGLEERLVSRFQWGLVTDVQPPEVETRIAILRTKADQERLELPQDVAYFIAQAISTNIRELEGALIRVTAYASMMNQPVTLELAQEAMKDLIPIAARKPLSIDRIRREVAAYYDVRIADMNSSKRSRQIAFPRQVAMYLCRELTSASLEDVGDAFGGRDHTTVMHAYRKIADERTRDPILQQTLETLFSTLQDDPGTHGG